MKSLVISGLIFGAVAAAAMPAQATIIGASVNVDLQQNGPVTISFGSGSTAAYMFSYIGSGPKSAVDAVSTSGSAQLGSDNLGDPLFSTEVGAYQIDSTIGAGFEQFSAFPSASPIPFSLVQDYVGLSFLLNGQTVYGYAEVFGSELVQYAYDTTGASIQTAAAFTAVPEPASLSLLAVGVAGLFVARRKRRKA